MSSQIDEYTRELQKKVQEAERLRLEHEIKENTITKVSLDERIKDVEEKVNYVYNLIKGTK